jgi:hypothetical protein
MSSTPERNCSVMPDTIRPALTEDDLVRMEHRARRFQGAWTGTSGTLAADVMRLLAERLRLLELLAEAHGKH